MNRRLVLEAPVEVPDGAGGYGVSWVARGTLWAAMEPGVGRDGAEGEVTLGEQGWRITVRAAPVGAPSRPKAGERLRAGARVFAVLSVAEVAPEGRYLSLTAREEVVA